MTTKLAAADARAADVDDTVSSGFTSRDTSFHGFETGTASATPGITVNSARVERALIAR